MKTFQVEKQGKKFLADDRVWPYLKQQGFSREGDDAEAATAPAQSSGELRLNVIGGCVAGQTKSLQVDQQVQGDPGSVAGVQFSTDSDGPWETCRPDEGAVEAAGQPWDARDQSFSIDAKFNEQAYVRVGVWPDQGLTGTPVISSNAEQPRPWAVEAPE
jgi:hypothetical protein